MRAAFQISVQRACRLVGFSRAAWYKPRTARDQTTLRMPVRRRKHMALHRESAPVPTGLYQRWSMDFVNDQLFDGRPFRVLTVVDQWSRQSPILECGFTLTGRSVVAALERVALQTQVPVSITVDHGTEFMSKALEAWAFYRGVPLDFTRSGKPTDNSHIDSSTGACAMRA
jgi:putative transposase